MERDSYAMVECIDLIIFFVKLLKFSALVSIKSLRSHFDHYVLRLK